MFIATFNNVLSLLPHLCCRQGVQEAHVLYHLQYSVIYHTFALGRGFKGLMFNATFNIVSIIYHTFNFAVGRG